MSTVAARLRGLKREELRLRSLRRRIRLEKQRSGIGDSPQVNGSSSSGSSGGGHALLSHIPENRSLEATISLLLTQGRDPRVFLHLTQRLLGSTVISLAANTHAARGGGRWDPLDVKPQVFALGKHMALPIFTSVRMLRQFCWKHDFSVRGPDGAVWAQAGCAPPDAAQLEAQRDAEAEHDAAKAVKENRGRGVDGDNEEGGENSDVLSKAAKSTTSTKSKKPMSRKDRKRHAAATVKRLILEQKLKEDRDYEQLLADAAAVEQFEMRTVSPLHVWGAPRLPPYFHGYYGLLTTVLENASVLPDTDIVLNPATPLELALSSNLTAEHLARRNAAEFLVHSAFQRVEKAIRKEFFAFFAAPHTCPEVVAAHSVTLRRNFGLDEVSGDRQFENQDVLAAMGLEAPVPPELLRPDAFDIVVLVESSDFGKTARSLRRAKAAGALVGHASLRVIPLADAPPHVREVAEPFYSAADHSLNPATRQRAVSSASAILLPAPLDAPSADGSNLELLGDSVIANAHVSPDEFFSNPALAYTEPHAAALRRRF